MLSKMSTLLQLQEYVFPLFFNISYFVLGVHKDGHFSTFTVVLFNRMEGSVPFMMLLVFEQAFLKVNYFFLHTLVCLTQAQF